MTLTYRLWGVIWIVLFSWQCQNLCLLSLAFIIDWRVVKCWNSFCFYKTSYHKARLFNSIACQDYIYHLKWNLLATRNSNSTLEAILKLSDNSVSLRNFAIFHVLLRHWNALDFVSIANYFWIPCVWLVVAWLWGMCCLFLWIVRVKKRVAPFFTDRWCDFLFYNVLISKLRAWGEKQVYGHWNMICWITA